jgi:hypothetical protein
MGMGVNKPYFQWLKVGSIELLYCERRVRVYDNVFLHFHFWLNDFDIEVNLYWEALNWLYMAYLLLLLLSA